MEKTNNSWLIYALIAVLVILGIYYFFIMDQDVLDNRSNIKDVTIETRYDGKIVYGANLEELDADILKEHCEDLGGEFQECGDTCDLDASFCAQVCAYTCLLSDELNQENRDTFFKYKAYENNELGFRTQVSDKMEIGKESLRRIEFMYVGSDQVMGTELYDGVRVLVSRLSFDQETTLKEYAEELAQGGGMGTILQEVSLEENYDWATYTFARDSLGVYKHYIALVYPGEILDVNVFISDEKYQEMVDEFLDNFTITDSKAASSEIHGDIRVDSPKIGQSISSPLVITGQASGTWFFEASFTATLTNWDGLIIGESIVQTSEDWMTEEMIPFTSSLEFDEEEKFIPRGILIIEKANPSGLPENSQSLEFPVYFNNK